MDPQFKIYAQQQLDAEVGAQTIYGQWVNGFYQSSGRDGGFTGNVPPKTPTQFHDVVAAETAQFKPDSWSLDEPEALAILAETDKLYVKAYAKWGQVPLAGDAPPAVVAWWNSVQK